MSMIFLKKVNILLFLVCFSALHAQWVPGGERNDNEEIMNEFLKGISKNANASDKMDGSPYLSEEFEMAQLIFPKGDPLNAKVRYNVAKEEMQVKMDEDEYRVLHPGVVVMFRNNPYKMLSYKAEDKTVDLMGYFEFLTPDSDDKADAKLLRKNKKKVRRGKAAAAMQEAKPPRYVDKDDFYIQFGDSKPVEVERGTKKFIAVFPEAHQDAVKDFMNENNLKSKDEQDLKSIINFYNSQF